LAEKIERKIAKATDKSLHKAEMLKEKLAHLEEKAEGMSAPVAEKKLKKLEKKSEKMAVKIERKLEKGTPAAMKKAEKLKSKLAKVDWKKEAVKAVISRPVARYIRDITYSDGTVVTAGTSFIKTWRMHNDGTGSWKDVVLMHVGGESMGATAATSVPNVAPGAMADVSVALVAPSTPGRHCGYFRLATKEGTRFGNRIWVDIVVEASLHVAAPVPASVVHFGGDVESGVLPAASAPPAAVVVDEVKVSTKKKKEVPKKWATELKDMRGMGFDHDETHLIGLLDAYNGDLSQVIPSLFH